MKVQKIDLKNSADERGSLAVLEEDTLPFIIKRIFSVTGHTGALRGEHSHKECSQFIFCISGNVEVLCDDGKQKKNFILLPNTHGILIPPGIWSQQTYLEENTIINVICDRAYESEDYIHNYEEFLKSQGISS